MASFVIQAPGLFFLSAGASATTVNYPLAVRFSSRLDPATNQWFVDITNVGTEKVFVIFSISPGSINSWTDTNQTTLAPGAHFTMATHCFDSHQNTLCTLTKGKQYNLVYDAWTSISRDSIDLSGIVSASNQLSTFDTYPYVLPKVQTVVTCKNWTATVSNAGTQAGTFQAYLSYTGTNYQNQYHMETSSRVLVSATSFQTVKQIVHQTYSGAGAIVDVYGYYSHGTGLGSWSATLDLEKIISVK